MTTRNRWASSVYPLALLNKPGSMFHGISLLFSRHDKWKLLIVVFIQFGLGILDLIGVATIGILGSVAISGIQSAQPGTRVTNILNFIGIDSMGLQTQVMILGLCASTFLVMRTILSIFFSRKVIFFMSRRGALISSQMFSKLISQSLDDLQARSMQQNLYGVTYGVSTVTVGIIGTSILVFSDLILLIVMFAGLLLIDPVVALLTLSGFILLGYGLYRTLHLRASELGKNLARLSIESNQKITEVLKTYREAVSQNRRYVYSREVAEIRMKHAEALAEISFMPNISKYIVESAMIVGVLIISAFQFVSQDSKQAVATLAVFLAAGTRIAPSVLRIQQGLLTVKTSIGSSKDTLDLMRSLKDTVGFPSASSTPKFDHVGFDAKLKVNALNFKYRNGREEVIKDINLSLEKGKVLAVVGPSGAGKSTLADLILGALIPNSGSIRISGETPLRAAEMWPGALSYVPQEVVIIQGTLRDNIMLGYEKAKIYDEQVLKCIDRANLSDLLKNLPHGLDSEVGDSGYQLSGGQKQRLGIARALFTNPSFLVLDEATSALDSQSEREISDSIRSLREHTTIIIIAHRLSTVRDADIAIYLNNGRIEAMGSFEHLREKIQNFDKQAKLLGI